MLSEFTVIIHSKGWTVKDACRFWNVAYETYVKRTNNPKMHNQLKSMCLGLEDKRTKNEN